MPKGVCSEILGIYLEILLSTFRAICIQCEPKYSLQGPWGLTRARNLFPKMYIGMVNEQMTRLIPATP